MIKKCKLNSCAHCKTKENLHPTFSTDGKLYFVCSLHKTILNHLDKAYEEGLVKMKEIETRRMEREKKALEREMQYN